MWVFQVTLDERERLRCVKEAELSSFLAFTSLHELLCASILHCKNGCRLIA